MANLQKSALQARLAKLPYLPTVAPPYDDDVEEREEAMSSLAALPTIPPPGQRYDQKENTSLKLTVFQCYRI